MQVGVIALDSSYWCFYPLSLKRWILLEVVIAIVGFIGTFETAILMILSWLFCNYLMFVFENRLILNQNLNCYEYNSIQDTYLLYQLINL